MLGPQNPFSAALHAEKYCAGGESFREAMNRVAAAMQDNEAHYHEFREILQQMRFMPGGRIQAAMGSTRAVTAYNCYVSQTIEDSFTHGQGSIMECASRAAETMRMGGGIGYDFSTLRPRGATIMKLQSNSTGPVSFMEIFDAICRCVSSSGHRRGAQMGVLRVDHPDIEEFVHAKREQGRLEGFNISVAITDEFMECVKYGRAFDLRFEGRTYKTIDARQLWETIMRSCWDWAEPGVLFIDTINRMNNLHYCEKIAATNPSMPAGTRIATDLGMVPIEALDGKRFQVKSLSGAWVPADCWQSGTDEVLLEIELAGSKQPLRCTPRHRWPVLLNGRYVKVFAEDLVPGDWIPANRCEMTGINPDTSLTYTDGLVAGLAFGDGSYNVRQDDGRAYLHFHQNKKDSELSRLVADYFHATVCHNQPDEDVVHVSTDAAVRAFLNKVGLELGDKTALPETVWKSNDLFVSGFLDGLFSSDGHVSEPNRTMVFTNKNQHIGHQVQELLSFYGILSTTRTSTNKEGFSRTDVTLPINSVRGFAQLFRLSCLRKATALAELTASPGRQSTSSTHVRVQAIRQLPATEAVWDISVYHDQHVFPVSQCYTGNCGEQPLPPDGACLLGSFNLVKYLKAKAPGQTDPTAHTEASYTFDFDQLVADIPAVVRAMDNVVDRALYPLYEQEKEAKSKRRMGLGVTGLANAIEAMGFPYGTANFVIREEAILRTLTIQAYRASCHLAKEKGPFPLYDEDAYLVSGFLQREEMDNVRDLIRKYGIRNSHLISYAPTGTISLAADNVSSGIEPVFAYSQDRLYIGPDGPESVALEDYGRAYLGRKGRRVTEVSIAQHLSVLKCAARWADSAVSKTVNLTKSCPWDEFKRIYVEAWEAGVKGCTVYNVDGRRGSVLTSRDSEDASCRIDPVTGRRDCD